jgi:hypothetical protein
MDCYRHPGTVSTDTCISCSKPICAECREEVAGHPMCQSCVTAAQDRLATETAAAPSPAFAADPVTAEPVQACGFAQYARAVLFGGIAAVVGAIIWDKFVLFTGWQIGLIAVVLGVMVGVAVRAGAQGRRGKLLPWIGALLAGFAILLGYALLGQDQTLRTDPKSIAGLMSLPLLIRIPILMILVVPALDLLDWVFVAIGVWEGWSIPRRGNQEAEMPAPPAAPSPSAPTPQGSETPQS